MANINELPDSPSSPKISADGQFVLLDGDDDSVNLSQSSSPDQTRATDKEQGVPVEEDESEA